MRADPIALLSMHIDAFVEDYGLARHQFLNQIRESVATCPRVPTTPDEKIAYRIILIAIISIDYCGDAMRLLDDIVDHLRLTRIQVLAAEEFIQVEGLA